MLIIASPFLFLQNTYKKGCVVEILKLRKMIKQILIILFLLCMGSCTPVARTTAITDSLVNLFITQSKGVAINDGRELLIVEYVEYVQNEDHYEILRLSFRPKNQTMQSDSIIFLGKDNLFFRNGYDDDKYNDMFFVDDLPTWEIVLTNNKLNPYLTSKYEPTDPIDDVISLFIKYGYMLIGRDEVSSYVFSDMNVEERVKPGGYIIDACEVLSEKELDSLQLLVWPQSIYCCTYVVDTLGRASFYETTKSLIPKEIESQFVAYCDSISRQIIYSPAKHRGVFVNSVIGYMFWSHRPGESIRLTPCQ